MWMARHARGVNLEAPPASPPDLAPSDVARRLASGEVVLVDVRERFEWDEARIPGAIHVPLHELLDRIGDLPRDRLVVLQCRSGNRSRHAADVLAGMGHANLANLDGGILAWARAGHPVEA